MGPMSFDQVVALGGILIAAITLILNFKRDGSAEHDRQAAQVAENQVMRDKLDGISDMSRETRDTVREMSKQLNGHSMQLTRLEQRMGDNERRMGAIEDRMDGIEGRMQR